MLSVQLKLLNLCPTIETTPLFLLSKIIIMLNELFGFLFTGEHAIVIRLLIDLIKYNIDFHGLVLTSVPIASLSTSSSEDINTIFTRAKRILKPILIGR